MWPKSTTGPFGAVIAIGSEVLIVGEGGVETEVESRAKADMTE